MKTEDFGMNEPDGNFETRVALFQKREIRRTMHNNEWWFVITDIIAALTDSSDPSGYWKKMRKRDPDLGKALQGGGQFVPPLAFEFATAGGPQKIQCWNTEGIFRLIQSIPSPKVEPLKRWLARVGKDIETQTGKPVISGENFKQLDAKTRKKLRPPPSSATKPPGPPLKRVKGER